MSHKSSASPSSLRYCPYPRFTTSARPSPLRSNLSPPPVGLHATSYPSGSSTANVFFDSSTNTATAKLAISPMANPQSIVLPSILEHCQSVHQPISPSSQVQPSITISQPEDLICRNYSAHQHARQFTLGPSIHQGSTYYGEGIFSKSQNFSVNNSTFIDNSTALDDFMKTFLLHTIMGAEYDSSDRDPPPRCHPGTRLAIIERCKVFIIECSGEEKMRWIVGPAGVGKSAIMQVIAEETPADASVFFSINGRRDGTKIFTTIAYQLAVKYEVYRQFIWKEMSHDPSLFRKALRVQFKKFIGEPFIHQNLFHPSKRFIVIIDGLDECADPNTQQELLELISDFCLAYPASPIVWLIASRTEPHITSFFDDAKVMPAYTKEEIMIDSDEACEDVQRYLREELNKIKRAYPTLKRKREWPSELEFIKIATAAGGLFAYASTVVRYIGDPYYGDPVSQLDDVLIAIDAALKDDTLRGNNPFSLLDALYANIISKIPAGAMRNTTKLLLVHSDYGNSRRGTFRYQCNKLGLTEDAAYGAVRHLHAVVKVPAPDEADRQFLTYFHKSFKDFLFDFKRSGFLLNARDEVDQLEAQCSFRIVAQVPDNSDGTARGEGIQCHDYGYLEGSPGFCDTIALSWPGDERSKFIDHRLRCDLYRHSMIDMCTIFSDWTGPLWNVSCFHALTTRFTALGPSFPIDSIKNFVFDEFHSALMDLDRVKQVPLRTLDYAAICGWIGLWFSRPVGTGVQYSDPWDSMCKHQKTCIGPQSSGWSTAFAKVVGNSENAAAHVDIPRFNVKGGKGHHWQCTSVGANHECPCCLQRLARHFITNPDKLAFVFVDSTGMSYVEVSFVDPDDGTSEWRYRFCHSGSPLCVD